MKKIFKYMIVFIIFICSLYFLTTFYNKENSVSIGENIILKIISEDFSENEKEMVGIKDFYSLIKESDNIYVPIDYCNLISYEKDKVDFNDIKVDRQEYTEEGQLIDGADEEEQISVELKLKFIDNFEKNGYNKGIKYKYDENKNLYIHLNSFEYIDNKYIININGYIFKIDSSFVPLTYQNYVEDMLNFKNIFEISDIVNQRNSILYTFSDNLNGYNITVKYIKNFFGYAKDIKISMPFISIDDLGVCRIFKD